MMLITTDTAPADLDALAEQIAAPLTDLAKADIRDGLIEHLAAIRGSKGVVDTTIQAGTGDPRTVDDVDPIEWVRISTDTATGETTTTAGTGSATGPATVVSSSSPGSGRISR